MNDAQAPERARYPNKAWLFGPLCITTVQQGTTTRRIDPCWTHDQEGRTYRGVAILFRLRRSGHFRQYRGGRALVLAWRSADDWRVVPW